MLKLTHIKKLSKKLSMVGKFCFCFIFFLTSQSSLTAQYRKLVSEPPNPDEKNELKNSKDLSIKDSVLSSAIKTKKIAVALDVGLPTGIGIECAYRLSPNWGVRAGFNFADLNIDKYKISFTSKGTTAPKMTQSFLLAVKTEMSQIPITFEFYPSGRDNFRILGGIQYIPSNKITVGGQLDSIVKFNDVPINSDDLGSGAVTMSFSQNIVPFLGIGFGSTFPKKRFAFSCDLTVSYRNDYKFLININQGIILKSNEENAAVLEHNFNRYWYQKIWPMLNLRLSYALYK